MTVFVSMFRFSKWACDIQVRYGLNSAGVACVGFLLPSLSMGRGPSIPFLHWIKDLCSLSSLASEREREMCMDQRCVRAL